MWRKAMFDRTTLLLFLTATWTIIVVPGPDILYVLARSVGNGRRAGVISGLGIGSGDVIHTVLAMFGLAPILATSLTVFYIIKYMGAFYLIYLGIKTLYDKNPLALPGVVAPMPRGGIFWQGVLTNLLNSQAVLF